jgi:hypothetical protein
MLKALWSIYALLGFSFVTALAPCSRGQRISDTSREQQYSFRRSWSFFSEYSPDSSHIILGGARKRQFFTIGGAFTQRFFAQRYAAFSYMAEIRPFMLESDPVLKGLFYSINIPGHQDKGYYVYPHKIPVLDTEPKIINHDSGQYYQDYQLVYDRRWTYSFGLSPVGFQANFLPRSRIQPVLTGLGGFAASPRDIPMFDSSAFNFTFSIGAGVEIYRTAHHASRIEYRIQHLSSANIGATNPGIDSQVIRASFSWGR